MNFTKTPSPLTDKTDKTPWTARGGGFVSFGSATPRGFSEKESPFPDRLKAVLSVPAVDSKRTGEVLSVLQCYPWGFGTDSEDLAAVLGMRLSASPDPGMLRIKSQVLGEDVILAGDNATALPPGVIVYRRKNSGS
jgi:hypothetical protein